MAGSLFLRYTCLLLTVTVTTKAKSVTCENIRCLRFFNAECRDDHCDNPPCAPHFFFRGRNVTNRCTVERCNRKSCHRHRQCKESIEPTVCPRNRPQCRQLLKAKCILGVNPASPTTCSDMICGWERACRMRTQAFGQPVARCILVNRLKRCDNVQCDSGFTCVLEKSKVSCVLDPTHITTEYLPNDSTTATLEGTETIPPSSCSELHCPETQRCIQSSRFSLAVCIDATVGLACEELRCPSHIPVCLITLIPEFNSSVITSCAPTDITSTGHALHTSSTNTCEFLGVICEFQGLECADRFEGNGISAGIFCTSLNCSSEENNSCPQNHNCVDVPSDLAERIDIESACFPDDANVAFGTNCRSRMASTCEKGMTCIEIEIGELVGAYCIPGTTPIVPCSEKTCPKEYVCTQGTFEARPDLRFSTCTPEADSILSTLRLLLESKPKRGSGHCRGLECADNKQYLKDPRHTTYTEATLGLTCDKVRCPFDATHCSLNRAPSLGNVTIALCTDDEAIENLRNGINIIANSTCKKSQNLCEKLGMTCINKIQAGKNAGFYCTSASCTNNEENCLLNHTCTELPSDLAEAIKINSVCVPPGNSTLFGSSCSTRHIPCTPGTVCTEAMVGKRLLSSFCTLERLPTLSCRDFTCPGGLICVESTIDNELQFSYCANEKFKKIVTFMQGQTNP